MDFQSAMETFAEAWVVANAKNAVIESQQNEALSLTCSPSSPVERGHKQAPPVMFGKEPATEKHTSDKSLPVHCVVETISSLEEDRDSWRRKSHIETDSYVIIPINTAVHELLLVALTRLGYPKETAAAAKGSVLLRNWRPLPLDTVAPSPLVTVGELLGELSTVATLRIQVLRPRPSLVHDMKDKLLKLLLIQSHGLLVRSGCPLDTLTLSNLCRESSTLQHVGEPSEELRCKFEAWVSAQLSPALSPALAPPFAGPVSHIGTPRKDPDGAPSTLQAQLAQKTRMRTSFDPELELPKLQKWFQENQHPSRQQIQQYVKELNNLDCRRGRKPLDMNNVVYWFKNARAAQKRAELRGFCSPLFNMPVNGFQSFHNAVRRNTEQQSLSDDDLSRASDADSQQIDVNDSDADMPLSLTTTANSHSESGPERLRIKEEHQEGIIKREHPTSPLNSPLQKADHGECLEQRSPPLSNGEPNGEEQPHNRRAVDEAFSDEEDGHDDGRSSLDLRKNCSDDLRSPSPASAGVSRLPPGFPLVPNSMFSHSIMYMSHYMPGLGPLGPRDPSLLLSPDERRKRNRTFIDPVTEVPRLEQWFSLNTHPSHNLILKYTEELNRMPYRQKFPRLEPKNVQFWFKNRRAKCKRLKMSLFDSPSPHYPPN